jgi:xylulokinase
VSVLGIDVGTTGCKAIVVSSRGVILGHAHREYSLQTPAPGWAELDAAEVWAAISSVSREVILAAPGSIDAVGVSSAGEVALPTTRDGSPLGPAIVSLDTRSLPEFDRLVDTVGLEKLTSYGGFEPRAHQTVTRWLWLHEHQPELYGRAHWLVGWMELICLRLGLAPTMDRSLAVRSLGFDVQRGDWDLNFFAELGLDDAKLSNVVASGELIGHARGEGCDDLGLQRGTPVIAGGLDQLCAAYGLAIEQDSTAMIALGTTGVLAACTGSGPIDPSLPRVPFVDEGTELIIGGTPAGAALLRWFREEFAGVTSQSASAGENETYEALLAGVDDVRASVLVLPHLGGSRVAFGDPKAAGAITGLTFGTRRVELVRALLDGVAYELAEIRDLFVQHGVEIPALVAAGGGSRSSAWIQIVADTLGVDVDSTASSDVAAYGAARFASGSDLPPLQPIESFRPRAEWMHYHATRREAFVATFEGLRRVRAATNAYDAGAVT